MRKLATLLLLPLIGVFLTLVPATAGASAHSAAGGTASIAPACAGFIQWSYIGPSGYVWATRWHPNIDNCQQRSKVKCASRIGTTIIRYGGWVTPTDKWSGVNCTNSYPVFSEGGVQTRAFAGAPLTQNKWLFSLTKQSS